VPILAVTLVGPLAVAREGLARRIADAAGEALGSRTHGTWVRLSFLDAGDYAENGGPPHGVLPVLVSVLLADPPHGDALAAQASRLTAAIAQACGRPVENVHLVYEPPARGRVAFGGDLLT
jgi:hypothetical protein